MRPLSLLLTIIFKFRLLENVYDGNILALYRVIEENKIPLVDIYGPNTKLLVFYEKSERLDLIDIDYFVLCGF